MRFDQEGELEAARPDVDSKRERRMQRHVCYGVGGPLGSGVFDVGSRTL